jgi:hypothetical protein
MIAGGVALGVVVFDSAFAPANPEHADWKSDAISKIRNIKK